MGKGIRRRSGSSPAWIKWSRHAKASPRLPVSRTQSVAKDAGGGFRSVGSVNTMGKTTVQSDNGGIRVKSVQRWNGNWSMKSGTVAHPCLSRFQSHVSGPRTISVTCASMQKMKNSSRFNPNSKQR